MIVLLIWDLWVWALPFNPSQLFWSPLIFLSTLRHWVRGRWMLRGRSGSFQSTQPTHARQSFLFSVPPSGSDVTAQTLELHLGPLTQVRITLTPRARALVAFARSRGRMLLSEHWGGHKVRGSPVTPVLPRTSRTAQRPLHYWTQSHIVAPDGKRFSTGGVEEP